MDDFQLLIEAASLAGDTAVTIALIWIGYKVFESVLVVGCIYWLCRGVWAVFCKIEDEDSE